MSLFVVRHGRTDWNDQNKIQGIVDIPLNNFGKKQAEETRKLLKNEKIDIMISSTLIRAKQTANIINKDRKLEIIYEEAIKERDFGEFEGFDKNEYNFKDFWTYSKNLKYERAENIQDFFKRVFDFLDSIKENCKNKNVLLVIHGGVSVAVHAYFEGLPPENQPTKGAFKNCEVRKYEFK